MLTVALLIVSNIFMTLAWYGQLRFPSWPIATAILIGWGLALIEYCCAVPANRIGYANGFTGGQLKIIQEIITLTVFAVFAAVVLKEPLTWRYVGAFACIAGAVAFMFVEQKKNKLGFGTRSCSSSLQRHCSSFPRRVRAFRLSCGPFGESHRLSASCSSLPDEHECCGAGNAGNGAKVAPGQRLLQHGRGEYSKHGERDDLLDDFELSTG